MNTTHALVLIIAAIVVVVAAAVWYRRSRRTKPTPTRPGDATLPPGGGFKHDYRGEDRHRDDDRH